MLKVIINKQNDTGQAQIVNRIMIKRIVYTNKLPI